MAFWAWSVAPQLAGPMVVFCSFLGQLLSIGSVRRGFEPRLVDKDVQRAIFQSFNLSMHAVTLAVYTASGIITGETVRMLAIAAPAMLVPTLLSARLYARLGHTAFRQLILVLLLLSSIALMASSIPHLPRL